MTPAILDGIELTGEVNVGEDIVAANVRHSIRLGHPQVFPTPPKPDRICLVGGGPSLSATFDELRELYFQGAKVVTVNGAYHWCLARNIRPSAQVVLDARASNARFVDPAVPQCRYYLCSQCAPETWAAVAGREFVGIWHADIDGELKDALDRYYVGQWHNVVGGTTVGTRAIGLLRMLGYLRFDLFGFDSCWMGDAHHGYAQAENDRDRRIPLTVTPRDCPELARTFQCAPWHVKQAEDFLLLMQKAGDRFVMNAHGDGLLAYMLRVLAQGPELQHAADAA